MQYCKHYTSGGLQAKKRARNEKAEMCSAPGAHWIHDVRTYGMVGTFEWSLGSAQRRSESAQGKGHERGGKNCLIITDKLV